MSAATARYTRRDILALVLERYLARKFPRCKMRSVCSGRVVGYNMTRPDELETVQAPARFSCESHLSDVLGVCFLRSIGYEITF